MILSRKTIRYYYWLLSAFIKKNIKLIIVSFITSFLFIVSTISLSPYFETFFTTKKEIIGLVGTFDTNSLPEEILSRLSNGLIYVNEKGEILPILASSWEVRNNGKEYRFHLKDNLIWDDGKKFTANDISYQFKDITKKVIDYRTIDFILTNPLPIFPTYLRKPLIRYPLIGIASLYRVNNTKTKYGNYTEINLEANKKGLPMISYKFYSNETQLISAYKRGDITQFTVTKKSIADTFLNWKNSAVSKIIDYSQLMTLFYNATNPLLKEKDIKNAISMTMDRVKYKDLGEEATGSIAPISWAYNPNLKKNVYDPDAAEKIIKKTVDSSKSASLNFITYYDYYDVADIVVSDLKKIGLDVTLTISNYEKQNNFDFLLALWKVPIDPDQYFFWHSTQTLGNIGNYKNVKVDKLLEDGRAYISIDDRKGKYFDLQRIMQDDPPAVFLFYPYIYTIKRK